MHGAGASFSLQRRKHRISEPVVFAEIQHMKRTALAGKAKEPESAVIAG